jgi:hypothetical protein
LHEAIRPTPIAGMVKRAAARSKPSAAAMLQNISANSVANGGTNVNHANQAQLNQALHNAINAWADGTATGKNTARTIVTRMLAREDRADMIKALKAAGLQDVIDDVEADASFKERQRQAVRDDFDADRNAKNAKRDKQLADLHAKQPTAEEIAKQARDNEVSEVIRIASTGTAQSRIAAIKRIQDILATGDSTGIDQLKKNINTAPLLAMVQDLPDGVIKAGALDVTETNNKATSIQNIDFTKLNAFQPVLLSLTIRYSAEGKPLPITDTINIGVKSIAHPVPSLDLVTGLGKALQRDSLLLQFFRMTSGETSFVKDFLLNLNVAKMRNSSRTSSGTKALETLRRQAEWNERRGHWAIASISKRGFVPPTTTIAITSDEVARIRSIYGIDFSKPAVIRDLLKSHNLMGFMIIDEAIGLARVFEDGDDDFDRIPLESLKKTGNDNSVIKDVVQAFARK